MRFQWSGAINVSTFTCAYTINHHYWTSPSELRNIHQEKDILNIRNWWNMLGSELVKWLRGFQQPCHVPLKVATCLPKHQRDQQDSHCEPFCSSTFNTKKTTPKTMGPFGFTDPTKKRSCVTFCFLFFSWWRDSWHGFSCLWPYWLQVSWT